MDPTQQHDVDLEADDPPFDSIVLSWERGAVEIRRGAGGYRLWVSVDDDFYNSPHYPPILLPQDELDKLPPLPGER